MPLMTPIPPALQVEDTCDFCFRPFAWQRGGSAICMNCGLENPRSAQPETAMLESVPEQAVRVPPASGLGRRRRVKP